MSCITRVKYMGELSKLLSGMAARDREAALAKYEKLFDEADSDEELTTRLGSPTFVALGELRGYVLPEDEEFPEEEPGPEPEEQAADEEPEMSDIRADSRFEQDAARPKKLITFDGADEHVEISPKVKRVMSVSKLVSYIIAAVIIGIPISALLILMSLAIFAGAVGLIAAGAFIVSLGFAGLDIFVDIMLLVGAGLITGALGLVLTYFAVWFFWRVVVGFISFIFRFGERWCSKPDEIDEYDDDGEYEDYDEPEPEEEEYSGEPEENTEETPEDREGSETEDLNEAPVSDEPEPAEETEACAEAEPDAEVEPLEDNEDGKPEDADGEEPQK